MSIIEQNDLQTVSATIKKIAMFQAVVQQTLKKDHDYGVIPGTPKPTLYKPGAEKINMLMQVSPEYEFLDRVVDFEKGFFNYEIRCTLMRNLVQDGVLLKLPVAQGVGSCNSMEKKYRWMSVKEQDLPDGIDKAALRKSTDKWGKTRYQIENDDPYTLANTVLKMAKKRAMIDATLQLASLSEVFTQDIEDMREFIQAEPDEQGNPVQETKAVSASNDPGDFVITFGKHSGKSLKQVAALSDGVNYLTYMSGADSKINAGTKATILAFLKSYDKAVRPLARAQSQAQAAVPPPPDDEDDFTLPFSLI